VATAHPPGPAAPAPPPPPPVPAAEPRTAALLRRCLLVLVGLSVAGTAVELAMLRHWKSPIQLVAWGALGLVALGAALLVLRPAPGTVRAVRLLAAAVAVGAAVGVATHVHENYEAGPLDYRYTATWAALPAAARWWAAASKTVGPAPPIAPAVLAQAALGLLFATARHPALARRAP
jgi:hypothetical protein